MMKRKLLSILALLCLTVSGAWAATGTPEDPWTSGSCTVTLSGGVLTVSGSGDMADYDDANSVPWKDSRASITSIVIESGVTKIGKYAFKDCSSLTSVEIPNSVTKIGKNAFDGCSSLTSVEIPNSVMSIAAYAFQSCINLTSVSISNSMTTIGSYVFQGCSSLTSVEIPSSVESISNRAFGGCSGLETLTVYAPSCTVSSSSFNGCNLQNIYVFSDKVDDYKSAKNWSNDAIKDKIKAIPALSAHEGASDTEYWTTYYNDLANAKIPDEDVNTQVFKVALSCSTLTLTEISDGVINMGEGVVLKSNSPSITLASAKTGTKAEGGYEGNVLTGTMTNITNPGANNYYVLGKGDEGVGFYKLSEDGTIGANKVYLTYDGVIGGAREFFLFNDATGIESVSSKDDENGEVYNLQGRRVSQPAKGLYIVNGKKYIKK